MADNELNLKITGTDNLSPVLAQALENIASNTAKTNDILQQAGNSLDGFGNKANQNSEKAGGLNTGMVNLASAVSLVKVAYEAVSAAITTVSEVFGKAIDEAVEAEKAQNKLTGALVATGNYTEKYVRQIDAYVKVTEEATGVSGEWIQETIAAGVQMGLTVEKAQQLEQAARQLSAATGRDLNESLSLLQGSLAGQSRALAKVFPQVKELTEGQLKQGDAIKLVTELTEAQYKLYEGSYSASLQKAKNALSNVYEEIGKIIIQNPIVKKGLDLFTQGAVALQGKIELLSRWIQANQETIERLATAFIQVIQLAIQPFIVAFGALSALWEASPGLITAIGVALTVASGPIGIAITAVTALTLAFAKWPGLFDMIAGVYKQMVGFIISGISALGSGVAKLVGVFNDDLSKSVSDAMKSLDEYALQLAYTGQQQQAYGESINETKDITFKAVEATKEETKALDENLKKKSDQVAANKEIAQSYAGIMIGTVAAREAMEREVQERDSELKKFEEYLNNKMRLAVSKAEEQKSALLKFQSEQTTGGGTEDRTADARAAIANEEAKQKGIAAAVKAGALTRAQYEEELFQSEQRIWQQKITIAYAASAELSEALGESPAGLQAKLALKQSIAEQELSLQIDHLTRLGATAEQIKSVQDQARFTKEQERLALIKQLDEQEITMATQKQMRLAEVLGNTPEGLQAKLEAENIAFQIRNKQKLEQEAEVDLSDAARRALVEQADAEHKAALFTTATTFWETQASIQEKAGNDWEAFLARKNVAQLKYGTTLGAMIAAQQTEQFKGVTKGLTDLSGLMNTHSKKAFDIGKAAAIANAVVGTSVAVVNALATPPFPLGLALAAVAGASGLIQIQKIAGQQYQGGQADEGMDSIPQSLAGKSFVLSQGERVVQPEANKELTDFLAREKMGNANGGGNYNITLNYNGAGSRGDAQQMADVVIDEIRKRSERGAPVISSKGVTS